MTIPALTKKHVLALPVSQWGHARPLVNLCVRLVRMDPSVTVSFLTTNAYFDRIRTELLRSLQSGEEQLAKSVRVISIVEEGDEFLSSAADVAAFKDAWTKLAASQEMTCVKTGTCHPAITAPQTTLIDVFAVHATPIIREISGKDVKVYCWFPPMTSSLFPMWAPEHLGGVGNIHRRAEDEVQRSGIPFGEALREILTPKGAVLNLPGIPPMYDHELHPQEVELPAAVLGALTMMYGRMEMQDGIILYTPESYEPEAVSQVEAWYKETGRPVYTCGPLLSSAAKAQNPEIDAFLDQTLATTGERSLLYMSLGSVFWPVANPGSMWNFLDVVMELQIPFIFSHGSPLAAVPDDIRAKVKAYGKGLISAWSPQQAILEHAAIGWFVSHGGHNSVIESVSSGVPLILWPFGADQPYHAARLSVTLDAGYELLEVRSGPFASRPIHRIGCAPRGTPESVRAEAREVLAKAFGEDGTRKRANLLAMRERVLGEWQEGGRSLRDVRVFLATL